MALPQSRNTTYAVGSQIKSVDLNDIQDEIIALEAHRIGVRTKKLSFADGGPQDPQLDPYDVVVGNGTIESNGAEVWFFGLGLEVGDRVLAFRMRWEKDAAQSWTAQFCRSNGDGTRTVLESVTSTTGAGTGWETTLMTVSPEIVVAAGADVAYYLNVAPTATGLKFASAEMDYDHPP